VVNYYTVTISKWFTNGILCNSRITWTAVDSMKTFRHQKNSLSISCKKLLINYGISFTLVFSFVFIVTLYAIWRNRGVG
jgi:hypothetical protein